MNSTLRKILQDKKKVRSLLIVVFLILFSLYLFFKITLKPQDIKITSQTSGGFVVTWRTKIPSGSNAYATKNKFSIPILAPFFKNKFSDERDQTTFTGLHKNHSVVISELTPNEEYFVRIGSGLISYTYSEPVRTANQLSELNVPNPSWGQIVEGYEKTPVSDCIVTLQLISGNKKSTEISTVTSEDGTWTIDTGNVFLEDLQKPFSSQESKTKVNVSIITNNGNKFTKQLDLALTKPTGSLRLKTDLKEVKDTISSTNGSIFNKFVNPVFANEGYIDNCYCNAASCGGSNSDCCDVLACAPQFITSSDCSGGNWQVYGVDWTQWGNNYSSYEYCANNWHLGGGEEPPPEEPTPTPSPTPSPGDCSCDAITCGGSDTSCCDVLKCKPECISYKNCNTSSGRWEMNMTPSDWDCWTAHYWNTDVQECLGAAAPTPTPTPTPTPSGCPNFDNETKKAYVEVKFINGKTGNKQRDVVIYYSHGTGTNWTSESPGSKRGWYADPVGIEAGLNSKIFTIQLADSARDVSGQAVGLDITVKDVVPGSKNPKGTMLYVCNEYKLANKITFSFDINDQTTPPAPPTTTTTTTSAPQQGPDQWCIDNIPGYGEPGPTCEKPTNQGGQGGKCINGIKFPGQIPANYEPKSGYCPGDSRTAIGNDCEWVCYVPKQVTPPPEQPDISKFNAKQIDPKESKIAKFETNVTGEYSSYEINYGDGNIVTNSGKIQSSFNYTYPTFNTFSPRVKVYGTGGEDNAATSVEIKDKEQPPEPPPAQGNMVPPLRASGQTSCCFGCVSCVTSGRHNGIDNITEPQKPVYSIADGKVVDIFTWPESGEDAGCGGYYVRVHHSSIGLFAEYYHLDSNLEVTSGQSIRQGMIIGYIKYIPAASQQRAELGFRCTASGGTHFHFGLSRAYRDQYLNPCIYNSDLQICKTRCTASPENLPSSCEQSDASGLDGNVSGEESNASNQLKLINVVRAAGNYPIADANVELTDRLASKTYTTKTDSNGNFSLNIPKDIYYVKVSKPGFETYFDTIEVDNNRTYSIQVVMESGDKQDYGGFSETEEIAVKYRLTEGWNLMTLNVAPDTDDYMASDLLQEIAQQEPFATRMMRFRNGRWEIYKYDDPSEKDFRIKLGEGYVLSVVESGNFEIRGKAINRSVPVRFYIGWNLIGVPYSETKYTAVNLIEGVNEVGGEADTVTKWDSKWINVIKDGGLVYGYDYPIENQNAYFVRNMKAAYWKP